MLAKVYIKLITFLRFFYKFWVLCKVPMEFLTVTDIIRHKHWTQNLRYHYPSHSFLQFLICLMHVSDISPRLLLYHMAWLWSPWTPQLGTFKQCQSTENIIQQGPILDVAWRGTTLPTQLKPLLAHLNQTPTTSYRQQWFCSPKNGTNRRPQPWVEYHSIKRLKLHDKSGI